MLVSSAMMWIVFGAVSAYMARMRGKNPYLWFFLGMFFGVFGLLFLFFSSKPKAAAEPKEKTGPTTIDITPKFDPSFKEKFWYYLDPQNQQNGPMSFDALVRAWNEGKVNPQTFVWNEGLETWTPFGEFIKN